MFVSILYCFLFSILPGFYQHHYQQNRLIIPYKPLCCVVETIDRLVEEQQASKDRSSENQLLRRECPQPPHQLPLSVQLVWHA